MSSLEDTLPGFKEAVKLGYALATYAADRRWAVYCKSDLTLVVRHDGLSRRVVAELCGYPLGAIKVTTGEFRFPSRSFSEFERQVREILNR